MLKDDEGFAMTEEEHAAMAQAVARAEMQGAEQEIPTNCAPLNGQFWETRNDYNGSDGYYYGRTVDIQWLCVAP